MASDQKVATTKSGAPDPMIGRVIADRYTVTSLIARGGMGKVYKAEQAPLGRPCAIKVLNPNYAGEADPEFSRRFFREASITSQIRHPNSVTIFDYGKTDDDIYFMVMEYLEGQTVHQGVRQSGPMPEERVGRIAAQVCRALREAHALGVIHRDLKPANIFLSKHGDDDDFVKVLDFGLVKSVSERPEEQLTQTGLFMGSPKYMAPEQIQGTVVDGRTDVYSLGIVMYEMLAGKVPFERTSSVNVLMAHVGEPPPPMRAVNPQLVCSTSFEDLVMRCIAKDPSQRFASMDHLLSAIKLAHGVSMTGQVPALSMSMSHIALMQAQAAPGALSQDLSSRRGVTEASVSGFSSGERARPAASSLEELNREARAFAPGRQSLRPAWRFALAAIAAAALGAGIGWGALMARQWANDDSDALTHRTLPEVGATQGVLNASDLRAVPATPGTLDARQTTLDGAPHVQQIQPAPTSVLLRLTSDPPGATVKQGLRVVCVSTPCDVAVPVDVQSAAPSFVFAYPGYRAELRTLAVDEPPSELHVKLSRAASAPPVYVPTPATTQKPDSPSSTPQGFKDLPY